MMTMNEQPDPPKYRAALRAELDAARADLEVVERERAEIRDDAFALHRELDAAKERLREYEGCPHCGCDHPPETMCAPHECRPGLTMTDKLVAGNIKYRRERDEARQQLAEERPQADAWRIVAERFVSITPGPHGRGVEVPPTPEYVLSCVDEIQKERDDAKKALGEARQQVAERDRQIRALREGIQQAIQADVARQHGAHVGVINILDRLLAAPAPAPDDENRRLREALENPPYDDYYDALREGCDHEAAWGCFKEAYAEHASAALAPAPDTKGEGEGDHAQH
jgi:hypothetical protein